MAFGVNGFNPRSKQSFSKDLSKGFVGDVNFNKIPDWQLDTNAFKFTPRDSTLKSRIRFYDHDSLWSRWRRGFELYTITQTTLGSFAKERQFRGDYRLYCVFQQFPGIFAPVRMFTFPSTNQEIGEQLVGIRDANSFNFYDYGLPILAVRYLGPANNGTYTQSGTTITITKEDHGFYPNESVYLDFTSGGGIDATLSIVSVTQNTITLTAPAPVTTSGNVTFYLSTVFTDERWTTTRVQLASMPTQVSLLTGERLADRVIEKDPGLSATYSRTVSTTTVTCSSAHGLSTGNRVFVSVSSGSVASGQYVITVTSSTQFTFTTIDSGATSGNLTVKRLISGFRYDDYVGYTVSGVDLGNNEIIFSRDDSYGTRPANGSVETIVPAHRGFEVGRFLTTEIRWNCSCQDFLRRDGYDLYSELTSRRFPIAAITSTKPGQVQDRDGDLSQERDIPGSFADLGYVAVNNFYQLPTYKDTKQFSYPNLLYYQLRWCKHIYAAMFSILHDEGNEPIAIAARYSQSGPNITVTALDHGLAVNTRIQLDFTSGNALSGQYTITSVPNKDSFVVVYPFSTITDGYCTVSNLREHEFVGDWLYEPSDKPVGDDLDSFYRSFDKEVVKLKEAAEQLVMVRKGTKWVGVQSITGDRNLPQEIGNYSPELIKMLVTDSIRRGESGQLDRDGISVNRSNRMLSMMSKLFNTSPTLIQDTKIGMLDKPLVNYVANFQFGLVDGGKYANGVPVEPVSSTSTIDCGTYSPPTAQDIQVSGGQYINT